MRAFKCDICGEFYSADEKAKPFMDINRIAFLTANDYGQTPVANLDICKDCLNKVLESLPNLDSAIETRGV